MMTLEKFEEASELVKKVTNPTKLIYSEYLSAQTGAKVYLKPENMQHTGAYKIRGAYYKISTLTDEERSRGLITASAGNHAQGVAFAAKWDGRVVINEEDSDYDYVKTSHGHRPHLGPQPVMLAKGPDFKKNVTIRECSILDEVPTFAAVLGVEMEGLEGRCLHELLVRP